MKCSGFPIPDSIEAGEDGITRARCLCRRQLTLVANVPDRRDTWRHHPKARYIR